MSFYYLVLLLLIVVYAIMRRLLDGTFGLTLIAIRENPQRAEMLGVDIRRHQLLVFVLGCTLGGLSGALVHDLGFLHHALDDGPHRGRDAGNLGRDLGQEEHRRNHSSAPRLLVWLSQNLAVYGSQYALILLGAILLIVGAGAPEGLAAVRHAASEASLEPHGRRFARRRWCMSQTRGGQVMTALAGNARTQEAFWRRPRVSTASTSVSRPARFAA